MQLGQGSKKALDISVRGYGSGCPVAQLIKCQSKQETTGTGPESCILNTLFLLTYLPFVLAGHKRVSYPMCYCNSNVAIFLICFVPTYQCIVDLIEPLATFILPSYHGKSCQFKTKICLEMFTDIGKKKALWFPVQIMPSSSGVHQSIPVAAAVSTSGGLGQFKLSEGMFHNFRASTFVN